MSGYLQFYGESDFVSRVAERINSAGSAYHSTAYWSDSEGDEKSHSDLIQEALSAADARIATLESELAALKHDIERATQRNSDLLAEVEGMREDAERYRLARAGKGQICICQETIVQVDDPYGDGGAMGDWKDETRMVPITGKKADAAIDAARKEAANG